MLRRTVIISLAINFLVQWGLHVLFWMGRFHAHPIVILLAPIAPPFGGVDFLANRDIDMACVSLVVTALVIGFCLLALLKPRLITLIPAHIMLVVYWFWSFALIGIGV